MIPFAGRRSLIQLVSVALAILAPTCANAQTREAHLGIDAFHGSHEDTRFGFRNTAHVISERGDSVLVGSPNRHVLRNAFIGMLIGGGAGYVYARNTTPKQSNEHSIYSLDILGRTIAGALLGATLGVLVSVGKT